MKVTFKDLKKRVRLETQQTQSFDILQNKPFWIWDIGQHKQEDFKTNGCCCFNHIVGLPTKEKDEKPMFDYQKLIYDSLINPNQSNPLKHDFKYKHLWIKKSTGLGITEFFLRLMAWLCVYNSDFRGSQMCIVTGPNIDIAIKLIRRLKGIFETRLGITFANKETVLELKGCAIEAFPSNHLDAYRALDNPKFIFIDEADFFRKSEQEDVRHVSERYIAKSDPYIVMVSTPNAPGGLFERIEREPEETCIYKRLKLDYTYGIDRIYTKEEIEKARNSPSFEREYNLKYLGFIGNIFSPKHIDAAVEKGRNYDPLVINPAASKAMGIDPGFGSSNFGIVIAQRMDGMVQVIYAEEFERPDYNEIVDVVFQLLDQYDIVNRVYVDGSFPAFIRSLKRQLGSTEHPEDYDQLIKYMLHRSENRFTIEELFPKMKVIPINFAKHHRDLLKHTQVLLEKECLSINPKFDKLITSLRTAVANEYTLDKESTSFDDLLDAYRMSLRYYYTVD